MYPGVYCSPSIYHLNRVLGIEASLAVVDLATLLTALVGPGEVEDRDEEEGVGRVSHTGKSVVPESLSAKTQKVWELGARHTKQRRLQQYQRHLQRGAAKCVVHP